MEHRNTNQKGSSKELIIQLLTIIISSILIHYILNGGDLAILRGVTYPKSLALALVLKLSFYPIKRIYNE